VFLLAAANYLLELGFFGRYAKLVMVLALAVGFIYLAFLMPTRQEMREHREAKRAARNRNDT
jgi:fatty acid desaturase